MYATDGAGHYSIITSSGWEIEEQATMQAVQELDRLANDAFVQVQNGEKSPLYFHMYNCRMDLQILSESTGLFKWRIRRHFEPSVFNKLSLSITARYEDALGITAHELCHLPEPHNSNDN